MFFGGGGQGGMLCSPPTTFWAVCRPSTSQIRIAEPALAWLLQLALHWEKVAHGHPPCGVRPGSESTEGLWGEGAGAQRARSRPRADGGEEGPGGAAALSCVWWSLHVLGANACEKQIYFCLRFIFFTLHGGRQRISSSMES